MPLWSIVPTDPVEEDPAEEDEPLDGKDFGFPHRRRKARFFLLIVLSFPFLLSLSSLNNNRGGQGNTVFNVGVLQTHRNIFLL